MNVFSFGELKSPAREPEPKDLLPLVSFFSETVSAADPRAPWWQDIADHATQKEYPMTTQTILIRRTAAATATALLALTALAHPASAGSNGCTGAPSGITCIKVNGGGLHVGSVDAVRDKFSNSLICNYSAAVEVTKDGASLYHDDSGVIRNGECVPGRAYIHMNVDREFPSGSKICIRFFENGDQQGGAPCAKIHR